MADLYQSGRDSYLALKRTAGHVYNLITDRSPKILILAYHRVTPVLAPGPLNNTVSLQAFKKQIFALAREFPVISLSEAVNQYASGSAKAKIQLVLTFDDGYSDNYELVFPFLRMNGFPAAFFLITEYVNSGGPLWDLQIINILKSSPSLRSIQVGNRLIRQGVIEPRPSFIFRVLDQMKSITFSGRQDIIRSLGIKSNNRNESDYAQDRCLTWEEARKMSDAGMEIGSHGLSHRSLAMIPFSEAREEIKESKEIIGRIIEKPCDHFSFPFGGKQDYNQALINYVREAGYKTCLLNIHGYNRIKKDGFCFKRIIMEEKTNVAHMLG